MTYLALLKQVRRRERGATCWHGDADRQHYTGITADSVTKSCFASKNLRLHVSFHAQATVSDAKNFHICRKCQGSLCRCALSKLNSVALLLMSSPDTIYATLAASLRQRLLKYSKAGRDCAHETATMPRAPFQNIEDIKVILALVTHKCNARGCITCTHARSPHSQSESHPIFQQHMTPE